VQQIHPVGPQRLELARAQTAVRADQNEGTPTLTHGVRQGGDLGRLERVLSPIDLIPEFLPAIGPLDDVVAVALALRDADRRIPREDLQEAWSAEQRILDRLIGDRKVGP
jgi:hypothetical protein